MSGHHPNDKSIPLDVARPSNINIQDHCTNIAGPADQPGPALVVRGKHIRGRYGEVLALDVVFAICYFQC